MSKLAKCIIALGVALGAATGIQAQSAGEVEYTEACAACHGASAVGDGGMAEFMSMDVPDLRGLSAGNDGVFPMLDVIAMIDGRADVGAHGREMPVWGSRYMQEASDATTGFQAELLVRGRVLALAQYLESIQR